MKSNNCNETNLTPQQKETAINFFKVLEKITGKKVLNNQFNYDALSDFSLKIRNYDEHDYDNIENYSNDIYLTEEQLEVFIQEMKSLANEI